MAARQQRRSRPSKTNPTRQATPPGPGAAPPKPARLARPKGSFPAGHQEREGTEVHRPFWRDPDRLSRMPLPDEAWEVFDLDEDSVAEPEPGDFSAPVDDEGFD